eukprot:3935616-Rhodomonas_salina.1
MAGPCAWGLVQGGTVLILRMGVPGDTTNGPSAVLEVSSNVVQSGNGGGILVLGPLPSYAMPGTNIGHGGTRL